MRLLLISTVAVLLAAVAAQSETFKGKYQIGKKSCQCTLKCKNSEKNCCTVGCDKRCTSTGQLSVPPYSFTVQCKKDKCRIKGLCSIDSLTTAGPSGTSSGSSGSGSGQPGGPSGSGSGQPGGSGSGQSGGCGCSE